MYITGIVIGVIAFAAIGVFHPVVVLAEYHFSKNVWPAFLTVGAILVVLSLFIENVTASAGLAVVGITSLWSIGELFHQEKRVEKGWFPKNPNRE